MSKARAIKLKCLDCSGESPKEVSLCPIFDCPLYPYRFGYSPKDKRYQKRMEAAARNYPDEYQEPMKSLERPEDGRNSGGNAQIDTKSDENTAPGGQIYRDKSMGKKHNFLMRF